MKKTIRIAALALIFGLLAGCASPRYIISTNDGTMIQTEGEPKLNKNTAMYEYTDQSGKQGSIRQSDVKQILKQ
jgi:hypothetical protein